MQFPALTHERMVRYAMALTRVLGSVKLLTRSRMAHATYASVLQFRRSDHGRRTQPCWSCAKYIQCASNVVDRSDMVTIVANIDV